MTARMPTMRIWTRAVLTLGLVALAAGCQTTATTSTGLTGAQDAYRRGDYTAAYTAARPIADSYGADSREASYIAGLSAYHLRRSTDSERYLMTAARSDDKALAGDAMASLGRLFDEQGRHDRAALAYIAAGERLTGEARAKAHFYAAVNQQKTGDWAAARNNLQLARQATAGTILQRQIDQQLQYRGWTIQVGAYSNTIYARKAAQALSTEPATANMGDPRLVQAIDPGGQALTLVQIGQFPSQMAASNAARYLRQKSLVVPLALR